MAMRKLETDYLVVGAGAMGMAFTDALIDHADVHVTLVDRRHVAGGHWEDAYPFVQLHQASLFYGVASTVLGRGAVQDSGPEAGLHERARQSEIRAYYDDILHRRFLRSGRVTFLRGSEYHTDGSSHLVTSHVSGETTQLDVRRRVVDAAYLAPTIPATTPPPFGVADDARVVPVNDLARLTAAPSRYVIVGSGKTATDGIVWLLANGVPPDRIVWVRPREPWMLNRAVVQPDPVVALGLVADTMAAAAPAESLDDLFLRLEAAGVMLRIDRDVVPTMAKTPTLGTWELDLLRTIENVVRLGHIKRVTRDEIVLDDGSVPLAPGSLVVHCAASGLQYPPLVPIWGPDKIRLQTIRAGFPCFCAALAGYVEATRDDDRERNRLCPPNTLPDRPADWAWMQVRGTVAARRYGAEPDIADWANGCALNPARIEPSRRDDPAVQAASARLAGDAEQGLARMRELARESRFGRRRSRSLISEQSPAPAPTRRAATPAPRTRFGVISTRQSVFKRHRNVRAGSGLGSAGAVLSSESGRDEEALTGLVNIGRVPDTTRVDHRLARPQRHRPVLAIDLLDHVDPSTEQHDHLFTRRVTLPGGPRLGLWEHTHHAAVVSVGRELVPVALEPLE